MNKSEQIKIEKVLKSVDIKPDPTWQSQVLQELTELTMNDVTDNQIVRKQNRVLSYFLSFIQMSKTAKIALSLVSALVLTLAGGTLLVDKANAAAPGDTLYTIDTTWEGIRRVFIISDEAQADYEMDLLDERAEELEKVEDEKVDEATDNLKEQQDKVQQRIEDCENNDNLDQAELERIRNRYETQTQTQIQQMEQVKDQIQEKQEDSNKQSESIQKLDNTIEQYQQALEEQESNQGEDSQIQNQNQNGTTDNGGQGSNNEGGGSSGNGNK